MESNVSNTDIVTDIPAPPLAIKNKGGAPPSFIWKFFSKLEQSNKKTNRYRAQCNFCQHVIEDGRVENLHKHILHVCQTVSQEVRQYVEAELDKKALEQGNSSRKSVKRTSGQTPRAAPQLASRPITEDEQEQLDIKLLRLLIMKNLPFTAVDSPWLLDFLHSLNPAYVPAGATKLQTSILNQEHDRCREAFLMKFAQNSYFTVSIASWCSNGERPVYALYAALSDCTIILLGSKQILDTEEASTQLTEFIQSWMSMLGPGKIAAMSSDNAGTHALARPAVVADADFHHITQFRCPMHALSLAVCQMLSFPWAAAFVGSAHEVASYLSSTEAVSALLEAGIAARALPCTLSQVQSVHACLESLLQLQMASVQQIIETLPTTATQQKVKELVSSNTFWRQAHDLCKLLSPLTDALAEVKAKNATLADVMLCWLRLATALQSAATRSSLPAAFVTCCRLVYNQMFTELDTELALLALALDPRYKDIPINYQALESKAKSVFQQRHSGEGQSLALQMQRYLASDPPFDKPVLPEVESKAWWLELTSSTTVKEISELAVMICHIVPHAASYERVASLLGWYHTPVRSQLDLDTLAKVVAVKSELQQQVPRVLKPVQPQEQQETFGCQLLDVPPLGANPAPEQLMRQLRMFEPQQLTSQAVAACQIELTADMHFNLAHPALLSQADGQDVVPPPQTSPLPSAPGISTHDFVKTCFAAMGRKQ